MSIGTSYLAGSADTVQKSGEWFQAIAAIHPGRHTFLVSGDSTAGCGRWLADFCVSTRFLYQKK